MIFYNDPKRLRKQMRNRGPGGLFDLQGFRELSVDRGYKTIGTRATPYGGYQSVERSYITNPYSRQNQIVIDDSKTPDEIKPGDVLDVALNLRTGEVKVEKSDHHGEIETATSTIAGSDVSDDIQRMFTEQQPALETQDNSSEIQYQQAHEISYEMISERAASDDTLQELGIGDTSDHSSSPDLESLLDADRPDDALDDMLHELGVDDVNHAVPDEDEPEYIEMVEIWG